MADLITPDVEAAAPADTTAESATVPVFPVAGNLPDAEGTPTGTIRMTALVDLVYADGVLTEIGFNAAQYTVFTDGKHLGVKSTFPKRRKHTVAN